MFPVCSKRLFNHLPVLIAVTACLLNNPHAHAFEVLLFPAAKVYDPDVRVLHRNLEVGEANLIVEDFEDEKLVAGLATNLMLRDISDPDVGPLLWDGSKGAQVPTSIDFKVPIPDVRFFGFGIGDNDGGGERLSINGARPIVLRDLANHVTDSRGRAYFVIIVAEPDDADISSVSLTDCFTVFCDHLIFRAEKPDPNLPLQYVVDLIDGSRLIGTSPEKSMSLQMSGRVLDVGFERVAQIEPAKGKSVTVSLRNGDHVEGVLVSDCWKGSTILGEYSIAWDKIRKISVRRRR